MLVRNATEQDAVAIARIYNHNVQFSTAIWNERVVDVSDRVKWIRDRQAAGYPVLVAQGEAQEVVGYASFGPWRPFDGYRHTVEHSVYVHPNHQRKGIGRLLLEALISRARTDGLHVMVAGIEAGNTGSIALHKVLGFEETGVMTQVGVKFGRWLDLAFLCLRLDDRACP
ncbi:N-acetyltransferase [Acetobacter tropicalis]|uniref:GCN5-related N-acetyltransferase n=1 Tax=Acetobacter tropicalis TaxID=104102 RepID=A0A095B648_9PROT|nr:GNAT family N-acetyltransferase [Acetobacter tropicalis]KAA8388178.1 N-acetyltransferase [Acetobacter tropicalis]KAA8390302.1 N-acetyltransferase [Acetobacter tropicalis]KGB24433.1 GCN5-related N-acetyltransferase [Acetobacter tropicalis]MBC9007399.1 N-acetyltransferase family protein [Acetobacter tropicalis]MDO8171587.1 N-acetyltransferase family protein [Acetobacter tropicalis]